MNKMKKKDYLLPVISILLFILSVSVPSGVVSAEEKGGDSLRDSYGMALTTGYAYDPEHISFFLISGAALFDYDRVWHHRAPDQLRFKVEYAIGAAEKGGKNYLMTSANILALRYLTLWEGDRIRPYVEAGIGVIYTGFRVKDQGLHLNFNPQMGFGIEFNNPSGSRYFLSFRAHHLSNGGLDDDNRGVNSVVMMLGRFF
jgi:lipid A 3-O-deacylase